jgi:hypothetical protein
MRVGVAQMNVNAAQTRLLFAGRMQEMLRDWACKAEAGPIIMRGTMDPQRDRQKVTKFRKTNSDFYNGYFAARAIVNRAAAHSGPKPPTPPQPPAPPSP